MGSLQTGIEHFQNKYDSSHTDSDNGTWSPPLFSQFDSYFHIWRAGYTTHREFLKYNVAWLLQEDGTSFCETKIRLLKWTGYEKIQMMIIWRFPVLCPSAPHQRKRDLKQRKAPSRPCPWATGPWSCIMKQTIQRPSKFILISVCPHNAGPSQSTMIPLHIVLLCTTISFLLFRNPSSNGDREKEEFSNCPSFSRFPTSLKHRREKNVF